MKPSRSRLIFWFIIASLTGLLFWAYAGHFDNPFHFDDEHTIVNNAAIRTFDLGRFLTDATSFSTLPANQAWRPGVTILNAIDTALSGGTPSPEVFHVSIFISYILLGILLYYFFLFLLHKSFVNSDMKIPALLGTGLFMLHTANAETINYIISRSDSFSTLLIILTFVLYFRSDRVRKYYLFLATMTLAFLVKETALMIAPLLLVYHMIYDKDIRKNKETVTSLGLTFFMAAALFMVSRSMTPENWTSGGGEWYRYLFTQAFVIVHYVFTFFLPMSLSADTDWTLVGSLADDRVIAGAAFIAGIVALAFYTARHEKTKGISFGLWWFLIALAPTSSVFPFAEVMNDHRIFFPFIGLALAATQSVYILWTKLKPEQSVLRASLITLIVVILCGHAYGTRQRCEVWGSGESLWKDVTEKSPGNGRGWMNYGLALMARNEMNGAIDVYTKALQLSPGYSYAHINMGIAMAHIGKDAEAEQHYKQALVSDSLNPACYQFYAQFLIKAQRIQEATVLLDQGLKISPDHSEMNRLKSELAEGKFKTRMQIAENLANASPTADNLIALSLEYYNSGLFTKCAEVSEKATQLYPTNGIAWNNLCAAFNRMGEFEKAYQAGKKALELQPNDELTKNNLAEAERQMIYFRELTTKTEAAPVFANWVNLSLAWYNAGNYKQALAVAEKAVVVEPENATGWNNICAFANASGDYDRAIEAGTKATQLSPQWELAKNNLAEAIRLKAQAQNKKP